jgi:long-chain acyl-CoA synthetase
MLLDALLSTAGKHRSRLAITDPFVEWDYGRLVLVAATMRDLIASNAKAPNVGLLLPSTGLFAASYFGCLWAAKIPVPLNFLLTPRELQAVTADAGLDLILSVTPLKEQASTCKCRVIYLDELRMKPRAVWRKIRGLPRLPNLKDDDVAAILYTSGTAGEPKGVCLTHRNILADSTGCLKHARIDMDRRFLGVLPLFHTFGLTGVMILPLTLGATVHYLPRFQPMQVAKTIEEKKIDILMAVPSMYTAMARLKDVRPEQFRSIYLAISGGEPLPQNVFELTRKNLGITVYEGYGMTETSPVISINMPWKHKPGSVGTPIPDVEVRIVDDDGRALPTDATGNIQVRGPILMKGYYKRPDLTRTILDEAGWLHTGDMGHIDAEGFVTISGRKKEMIIIAGENVFPAEIERVLEMHPSVAQAAVIGIRDATRGEIPVAYVLPHEGATISDIELRQFCRDYLATYKIPREIHITADMPRGPTGKIHKRKLQEMLASAGSQTA